MKVSVVIPQYKHYDLLHQVIFDLYKYCRQDVDEIVIVDDASNDPDLDDYIKIGMGMRFFPTRVFTNNENIGFLKTVNRGVEKASGDIVVILSNDVRIYKNICKEIKEFLQANEKLILGARLIDFNSGWNEFRGRIYQYLEGWLIACTKKAWNELGGFDERYGLSDFEDVDFSTTAIKFGYSLVELSDGARHDHPASSYGFNPEREIRTKKNRKLFEEKWTK